RTPACGRSICCSSGVKTERQGGALSWASVPQMLDPAHSARTERRAAAREATRQGRRRLAGLIAVVAVVLVLFLVSALGAGKSSHPPVASTPKSTSSSSHAPAVVDGGPLAPRSA